MTLIPLFNLTPTNVEAGRSVGHPRGREVSVGDGGFEQTLRQSRQQLERAGEETHLADEPTQATVPVRSANEQPTADAPVASEEAVTPKRDTSDAPEPRTAEGDDELAHLLAPLREWLTQQAAGQGEEIDETLLEDVAALAEMLTQMASSSEMPELLVKAGSQGDELARMVQQLATHGPRSARMADPLAALMAVTPGRGGNAGQQVGALEAVDLASVLTGGEGETSDGKMVKLGQMLAQAMPALAATGQQAGGQGASQGSELQSLLSQLVTATSASPSGQGTPGSELLTALMQAGPQATAPTGQAAGTLTPAAGPASAGELDGQAANASRLARAMQGAVNQGGGTMTLRMTPPELGTVRIQLQVQAGTVNAALHAETEGARTLLSQQLSQLRQALEGQGLHVERLSVQSMTGNQSTSASQDGQSDATPEDGRSRDEYRGSNQRQGSQRDDQAGEAQAPEPAGFEQVLDGVAAA